MDMPDMDGEERPRNDPIADLAGSDASPTRRLAEMVLSDHAVGELIDIDYEQVVILVHDHQRQQAGGVPLGCFLTASRLADREISPERRDDADAAVMLLRVTGRARLPDAEDTSWARFNAGQRAIDSPELWDAANKTDEFTMNLLRHGGLTGRILGTFRIKEDRLVFGGDIDNFYSGQALKVFKPRAWALKSIANFLRPVAQTGEALKDAPPVRIGRVRYSATEAPQVDTNVPVSMHPADIVARRTALFGMSRTGKSNTIKQLAKAIFKIPDSARIGQLIFDVNGEYAQDTTQDQTSLRSLAEAQNAERVVTYGMFVPDHDPERRRTLFNFYGDEPGDWRKHADVDAALSSLREGHQLIREQAFLSVTPANYIRDFCNADLETPEDLERDAGSAVRYRRAIQVYRGALYRAGFRLPKGLRTANLKGLFGKEVRALIEKKDTGGGVGEALSNPRASWSQASSGFTAIARQLQGGLPSGWLDDRLSSLLRIFQYPGGRTALRDVREWHDPEVKGHYSEDIVKDVRRGCLVIVDQTLGSPEMNAAAAKRIVTTLFGSQQKAYTGGKTPPDVIIYAEEAHNLLPQGKDSDVSQIWPRIAKEGSKYQIGLVYATQEPSSIQANILKATDNWFVAHLNSTDETRELRKYYDFADFEQQILKVAEPGFLRMRTLSNPYVVPVQIDRFGFSGDAV